MAVTPGLLDLILLLVLGEALAIGVFVLKSRARPLIGPFLAFLASGASIMAAMRVEVAGGADHWVAGLLGAAFVLHVLCLRLAWVAFRPPTGSRASDNLSYEQPAQLARKPE